MKKAILLIICMLTAAISQLFAQPMNRGEFATPGVQQLVIQYGDELNLSDAQKSELIALQIEHRNEFRSDARSMRRGDRGNFQNDRNDGRRGDRGRGFKNSERGSWGSNTEARMEMWQEVLDILTDEQVEFLQTKMIERTEKMHEFRTFRHEYIVNEAGIEGEKTEQVLSLLNAQSANRLEMAKQRILNPEEVNGDLRADHFQQMRETNDELRKILTVDEYESLLQNLGSGNRGPREFARGNRMWSR